MLSDRAAFARAICAAPRDMLPRLAFADWLDERGQHQRAELIRVQVEHAWRWPDHPERHDCDCLSCNRFRRARRLLTPTNQKRWGGPVYRPCETIRWYRGFVETISLPVGNFVSCAKRMFAAHPITGVCVTDRWPYYHRERWYWDDANGSDVHGLPDVLFANLSERLVGSEGRYSREFSSEMHAVGALARGCVSLGRLLAGLPEYIDSARGGRP